ncbi:hypothetical protein DY000_02012628 [Brassica cretica]|uniref:Ion transport domain-containing protein n=1 Tax=Brassica cretica TaxID=69181 RepID=A0ABQ7D276_BRACR|nr:hypothetical protein DY000_02012628 [Brassica cretica]
MGNKKKKVWFWPEKQGGGVSIKEAEHVLTEDTMSHYSFSKGLLPPLGVNSGSTRHVKLRFFIVSPFDPRHRAWDWFLVLLVVYTAWASPFEFGYLQTPRAPLSIIDNVVNGFFAIDIVLTFFVAFLDKATIQGYGIFSMLRLWSLRRASNCFARLEKDRKYNYFWVRCTKLLLTRIHTRRRTSGGHTKHNAAGKSILKMGGKINIEDGFHHQNNQHRQFEMAVEEEKCGGGGGGEEDDDDDHRFVVERDGSLTMEEDKTTSVSGSEELRTSATDEAERVWLELYQIGHLGFGKVSFTGI